MLRRGWGGGEGGGEGRRIRGGYVVGALCPARKLDGMGLRRGPCPLQKGGPPALLAFTCLMPSLAMMEGGKTRDEKARRKMSANWASRPPMPNFWKENSLLC